MYQNELHNYPFQNRSSGKWGYEIFHTEERNFRPLLTCSAVYDSREIAERKGAELMTRIEEMDLSKERERLFDSLGESRKTVEAIVSASRGSR